jgi:hypothetical protein
MRTRHSLVLACVFLVSCSNELTKDEARLIISQHYQLPRQTTIVIDKRFDNRGWPIEKYRILESRGLISIRELGSNFFGTRYEMSLTENARQYWLRNGVLEAEDGREPITAFKGYQVDVADVSVSSNAKENTAQAIVTLRFSNISPIQEVFDPLESNETSSTLFFRRFDDGWRIVEDENSQRMIRPTSAPLHWIGGWSITYDSSPADVIQVATTQSAAPVTTQGQGTAEVATVRSLSSGDRACYMELENERGKKSDEFADFDLCDRENLVGRRVRITRERAPIISTECIIQPAGCTKTDTVDMIVAAEVVP